jgi:hypothetical protein
VRRSICDFRLKQKDIQQMHSAEVAVAKAQAAADEKRQVEKEVAEIKKYKSFLERNEEVYKLAIAVVAKALKNGNLNAAAMGLAQANAATGQIKPLTIDPDKPTQSQTVNFNLSNLSDEELKTLAPIVAKLERDSAGKSKS